MSNDLVHNKLIQCIPEDAQACLDWHREQGHRLVLVTATVAPMAEQMGRALKMDTIYGCGPDIREGRLSGSEKGWSVPRRKGKAPIVEADAKENGHELSQCYGYGNTHADSWFMRLCGNPISVNPEGPLKKHSEENGWKQSFLEITLSIIQLANLVVSYLGMQLCFQPRQWLQRQRWNQQLSGCSIQMELHAD